MTSTTNASGSKWTTAYVYAQATVCLVIGVTCGYLLRGASGVSAATTRPTVTTQQPAPNTPAPATPEQLQRMGDTEAAPLLSQLQKTPNDPELLAKIGAVYYAAHDFKQAAQYYERSVAIRDSATTRTELGRAYYYAGDADRAVAEFQKVVTTEPGNANALFNLGMIRWKNQGDVQGAIAAWEQLLKMNPSHPRRGEVEMLIVNARQQKR